jgi:hypothetical protein
MNLKFSLPLLVSLAVAGSNFSAALAVEPSPAATAASQGEFALEPDSKDHGEERKEIENFLNNIESLWNDHNLDGVMAYYADDYINNDGLDKKAVTELTKDFWKTYPDAKSSSKTKEIRIDGNYATVESRDMAIGTTAKEMPGIGTKGDLNSISEGQLYIKKLGTAWKIIGDRIDFEKVRVAFGLARQLDASFSAPEQVKSGKTFSAKLELALPQGLLAVGSITSQALKYPQPQPADLWRQLDGSVLERVMGANGNNRNELLMATVGITNKEHSALMGIAFLTRRLNVVPAAQEEPGDEIVPKTASSETKAEKASEKAAEKASEKSESKSEKSEKNEK